MKSGLSMLRKAAATVALGLCALATAAPGGVNAGACKDTVYLTFDTGSMSQAELIADTLRRHRIHATFFLANEKTIHGDSTLDDRWAAYWKSLAADGHAFGTHTFDHVYYKGEAGAGKVRFRPQFGEQGSRNVVWGEPEFCAELKHSAERFKAMTGQPMDPLWRAPGGHLDRKSVV